MSDQDLERGSGCGGYRRDRSDRSSGIAPLECHQFGGAAGPAFSCTNGSKERTSSSMFLHLRDVHELSHRWLLVGLFVLWHISAPQLVYGNEQSKVEAESPPDLTVTHDHGLGSCQGVLRANAQGLQYVAHDSSDGFEYDHREIVDLSHMPGTAKLQLHDAGGRKWDFTVSQSDTNALTAFVAMAQFALGSLAHDDGRHRAAVEWLTRAHEGGSARASLTLGTILEAGAQGVERDRNRARELYNAAIASGLPDAIVRLQAMADEDRRVAEAAQETTTSFQPSEAKSVDFKEPTPSADRPTAETAHTGSNNTASVAAEDGSGFGSFLLLCGLGFGLYKVSQKRRERARERQRNEEEEEKKWKEEIEKAFTELTAMYREDAQFDADIYARGYRLFSRKEKCLWCHGSLLCRECGRTGKCTKCGGSGWRGTYEYSRCWTCSGGGSCRSCGGKAVCDRCEGRGTSLRIWWQSASDDTLHLWRWTYPEAMTDAERDKWDEYDPPTLDTPERVSERGDLERQIRDDEKLWAAYEELTGGR